jgi:hypothetical protein
MREVDENSEDIFGNGLGPFVSGWRHPMGPVRMWSYIVVSNEQFQIPHGQKLTGLEDGRLRGRVRDEVLAGFSAAVSLLHREGVARFWSRTNLPYLGVPMMKKLHELDECGEHVSDLRKSSREQAVWCRTSSSSVGMIAIREDFRSAWHFDGDESGVGRRNRWPAGLVLAFLVA